MFIPGESTMHTFVVPFVKAELKQVVVTYVQDDRVVFEKDINVTNGTATNADIQEQDGYTKISFEIGQSDSLQFSNEKPFFAQVNIFTVSHSRAVSVPIKSTSGIQFMHKLMPKAGV